MNAGFFLFLILSVAYVQGGFVSSESSGDTCPPNEVHRCSPPCEETCDYAPPMCQPSCVDACYCKFGYVRQTNVTGSPCVRRHRCPAMMHQPSCSGNEEFKECGSTCPLTCDDILHPEQVKGCVMMCVSGCHCKAGHVRQTNVVGSPCVPHDVCAPMINKQKTIPSCGGNEEFKECGSTCPLTCDDILHPEIVKACVMMCVSGCHCKPGYVRQTNVVGSPCVPQDVCAPMINKQKTIPSCGENEVFSECASKCPLTCDVLLHPEQRKVCTLGCAPSCSCKEGFIRSQDGKCVKHQDCCMRDNEVYNQCGTACPQTCDSGIPACDKQCVQGCFCKPNFVRQDNSTSSQCIELNKCKVHF